MVIYEGRIVMSGNRTGVLVGAPDEVRVPIIRVTEPEATSLPFFVVMRGKVSRSSLQSRCRSAS